MGLCVSKSVLEEVVKTAVKTSEKRIMEKLHTIDKGLRFLTENTLCPTATITATKCSVTICQDHVRIGHGVLVAAANDNDYTYYILSAAHVIASIHPENPVILSWNPSRQKANLAEIDDNVAFRFRSAMNVSDLYIPKEYLTNSSRDVGLAKVTFQEDKRNATREHSFSPLLFSEETAVGKVVTGVGRSGSGPFHIQGSCVRSVGDGRRMVNSPSMNGVRGLPLIDADNKFFGVVVHGFTKHRGIHNSTAAGYHRGDPPSPILYADTPAGDTKFFCVNNDYIEALRLSEDIPEDFDLHCKYKSFLESIEHKKFLEDFAKALEFRLSPSTDMNILLRQFQTNCLNEGKIRPPLQLHQGIFYLVSHVEQTEANAAASESYQFSRDHESRIVTPDQVKERNNACYSFCSNKSLFIVSPMKQK